MPSFVGWSRLLELSILRGKLQNQVPAQNSSMVLYGFGSFYLITATSCDRLHIYRLFAVALNLHVDHCCPKDNTARQLTYINVLSFTRRHIARNDSFPNKTIVFSNEKRAKAQKTRVLHSPLGM